MVWRIWCLIKSKLPGISELTLTFKILTEAGVNPPYRYIDSPFISFCLSYEVSKKSFDLQLHPLSFSLCIALFFLYNQNITFNATTSLNDKELVCLILNDARSNFWDKKWKQILLGETHRDVYHAVRSTYTNTLSNLS